MFSPRTKTLLRNVIRHTDTHNRIVEESDMWQQHTRQKSGSHTRSRSPRSSHRDMPRAHMDRQDYNPEVPEERDENKSTFWQRQLLRAEEKDPARWGHSGFKELYPDDFHSDRSRSPSNSPSRAGKNSPSRKKKHRHRSERGDEKKKKKKKKKEKKSKKHSKKEKKSRKKSRHSESEDDSDYKSDSRNEIESRSQTKRRENSVERNTERTYRSKSEGGDDNGHPYSNRDSHYSGSSGKKPMQKNGASNNIFEPSEVRSPMDGRKSRLLTSTSPQDANMFSRALLAVTADQKNNPVRKRPSPLRRSPSDGRRLGHTNGKPRRNQRSSRSHRSRSRSRDRFRHRKSHSRSPISRGRLGRSYSRSPLGGRGSKSSGNPRSSTERTQKDSRSKTDKSAGKYYRKRRYGGSSSESDTSDSSSPKRGRNRSSSDSDSSGD